MKRLLSGNEALALGAHHAGLSVAAAYPGTPSTEILENLAKMEDIYVEWSTNEKVAMEVAMGASYGGVRAMAIMKHVGLNVAADPFFAASVTGVRGGLVVISCDDPGMHSSQNEQDNRQFARFAKVPMLEPSNSQEAYDLMGWAFQISEEFDTPVLFRSTTRISHCKTVAEVQEAPEIERKRPKFIRDPYKFVMVPSNARPRHPLMEERIQKLSSYVETFPLNEITLQDRSLGIISACPRGVPGGQLPETRHHLPIASDPHPQIRLGGQEDPGGGRTGPVHRGHAEGDGHECDREGSRPHYR
jgi:indolepyruvate ferredoxin oxidoreductase alpha subunit